MNEDLERSLTFLADAMKAKLNEKPSRDQTDRWDKAKTIANWVAAIAVPVVLGISGYYVNLSLKGKEAQISMTSLAIAILKETPNESDENRNIRAWAVKVINYYSEVTIPEETQKAIIESAPLLPTPAKRPSSSEYRKLFDTLVLTDTRPGIIEDYKNRLMQGRARYEKVSSMTGVPWFIVGIIHQIERGNNFNVNFINGDPLNNRTIHFPSGRPASGNPPFSWEETAVDALRGLDRVTNWTIEESLFRLERYNGMGYYLFHAMPSPYLWGGSNHYTKGKYTADGTFSSEEVSLQIGAAVLLKLAVPEEELKKLLSVQPGNSIESTR